jgi:chromosome segregation ATPase
MPKKNLLIAFLVGVSLFSIIRYAAQIKQRDRLQDNLSQARATLQGWEKEREIFSRELEKQIKAKEQILQESRVAQAHLQEAQQKVRRLNLEAAEAKATIDRLNREIAALSRENLALKEQKQVLSLQIEEIRREKDDLEARLSSVKELKKALKQLRLRMRLEAARRRHRKQESVNKRWPAQGNKGYLIKDGKPTTYKKKIEVLPLP